MMYVQQSGTGMVWRVEEIRRGWYRLTTRDGQELRVPPQNPNKRVVIMEMTEAEAIELVQRVLGGTVIEP